MKYHTNIIIYILLFFSIFFIGYSEGYVGQEELSYVSDEVIIKLKDNSTNNLKQSKLEQKIDFIEKESNKISNSFDLELESYIVSDSLLLFKIPSDSSVNDIVSSLKNNESIEYVSPNYYYSPSQINTNDTYKDVLWGLDNTGQTILDVTGTVDADIDFPEAMAILPAELNEVIVAVIDNGVAYNHPDLINMMWDGSNCKDLNGNYLGGCEHGYDFVNSDKSPLPKDTNGHGTHVTGTIVSQSNNGMGIIGVSQNAKIMALRTDYSYFRVAQAIDFATSNGAKIINASFSGDYEDFAQKQALNRFIRSGGLLVAAAHNNGSNSDINPMYPASNDFDGIIAVAATNQLDSMASFSNWGPNSVDVAAPGVNILSPRCSTDCNTDSNYSYWQGTSMSAPHVVGLAALIIGVNSSLENIGVKNIILSTGDSLSTLNNKILTGKRINAANAINALNSLYSYIPSGGYQTSGLIPIEQINYSSENGLITINFKLVDSFFGMSERLKDFSYSIDGGISWHVPFNEDNSLAISDRWEDNDYKSKSDYSSGSSYSFTFNSRSNDSFFINNALSDEVKIRFKVNNGINESDYVVTENFSVDNYTQYITINNPSSEIEIDSNTYTISGSTNPGALVQVYKSDTLINSMQLDENESDFNIIVPLEQNTINNFIIKATEPIHGWEKTENVYTITDNDSSINISFLNINNLVNEPFNINTKTPTIEISGEEGMSCRFDTEDLSYSMMNSNNNCITTNTNASCQLPNQGSNGNKNIYISCIDSYNNETDPSNNVDVSFILNIKRASSGSRSVPINKQKNDISNNTIIPENNILINRIIKFGMNGDDVKYLQTYLNNHGYTISQIGKGSLGYETTYFGNLTRQAVIKFQKANGLIPDGIVGMKTREKLK